MINYLEVEGNVLYSLDNSPSTVFPVDWSETVRGLLGLTIKIRLGEPLVCMKYWRDCVGIEPTGDGTRLPSGFEDRGEHQCHSQPHEVLLYECSYVGAVTYSQVIRSLLCLIYSTLSSGKLCNFVYSFLLFIYWKCVPTLA